ncbi:unnamed protein product [Adineta ricciae]|uniref:Uncharacterized protein n=1 Tax=Adineta ricciae TaxID=249248 RepID=A0A815JDX7_ADIRI|nr:unnamed protein product [Adineta ricciae]
MLIDQHGQIAPYHERLTYVPDRDCKAKYNLYLLYPDRPKSPAQSYSIRIDIYEKTQLIYWASWYLPIPFYFLPVNRIATQLIIPESPNHESCAISCGDHGQCVKYVNERLMSFCLCDEGYSGSYCNVKTECKCANQSLCLTSTICVCPLHRFGSYCQMTRSICQLEHNSCEYNGLCVPTDDRIDLKGFTCFCQEDHSGERCERKINRIDIRVNEEIRSRTSLLLIHFITAFDRSEHERGTLLKKVAYDQKMITVYIAQPFHLLFVQIPKQDYYLTIFREKLTYSSYIQTEIQSKKRCSSINQLLNDTVRQYEYLQRVKYYPLLCRKNIELACFYDDNVMCICDQDRFSNCFLFNHTLNDDCQGYNYCENRGRCFQNNASCPTKYTCICRDCYYGAKCQFSTEGFLFTLDTILAFHIRPNRPLNQQTRPIQVSISISVIFLVLGLSNGLLSFVTLRRAQVKRIGTGHYLFYSSIVATFTILTLTYKFWLLILTQMSVMTNRSLLYFNCVTVDVTLRILLTTSEWLNSCVSVERMVSIVMGVRFQRKTSVRFAKRVIIMMFVFIIATHIHEPFRRQLIDDYDIDEHRIWCFVRYLPWMQKYNSYMTIFHFLTPFLINISCSLWIIIKLAYRRSHKERSRTLKYHLRVQIQHHQHLLYSPFILIVLSLPRLVISFTSGCMRSTKQPWLYLAGYFLSFVPSMSIFIVFVMPSKAYKTEFYAVTEHFLRKFRSAR